MIIVNCKDVLPIQHELLIHVADHIEAIPAIKHSEFVLSPIEHDDTIDDRKVSAVIQNYLESIGEANNFSVVSDSKKIIIKSINGKKINRITPPVKSMRTCCGI
ncbi:MAG: C2H2-type zinc finger protein [Nitrosopumilus sp.]|nr:C2H2-type zinc finger protein [Nitrosopumilus sp.]MDH3384991.1 C2H2-type zinc finger protein [Nitrosopumilus sp.]